MSAEQSKRSMDVDQELEDAIYEELSKKQCLNEEETVEEQFSEALSNIQEQAAIDRQKLVKKACEHYVARNGSAPSVEELEDIFETLADKAFEAFAPEEDDASDESSDSENDEEDSPVNANSMSKQLMNQINDALDFVHDLAKADKQELTKSIQSKWKEQNGSDITAEETEAVFAVVGKMFKDGPSSVSPGDDDEEDADYEPTDEDKQMEKEDAEVEEDEGEQDEVHIALAGDLEFTSATISFSDIIAEVCEELGLEISEEEDQTIEFASEIEVSEQLVESLKKACPGATEEDINNVLTSKITDAEFDEENDEDYEPEAEKDEEEEEVFEDFSILNMDAETEEVKQVKFLDAKFGDSDGEEYGFDDFAADHQDEQDSDEYSDSDEADDEDAATESSKLRPAGSVEKVEETQNKHANAMEIEQTEDAQIVV